MGKRWSVAVATLLALASFAGVSSGQQLPSRGTAWLLTSPSRQYLSGAGETFLMLRHGLLPRQPVTREEARSRAGADAGDDVRVNNPEPDSGSTRTQSEPSLAVFGSNVVVGWNDSGEFFRNGNFTGYGFSTDGGATFTDAGPLEGPPGGHSFGDPIVAVDHLGNFYFATLAQDAGGNSIIGVAKSADGGATFDPQVEASVGASNASDFQDKENMAVDTHAGSPFRGRIYVCWTAFFATGGSRIKFSRSTDGGASFSTAIDVSNAPLPPLPGLGLVQGCAIGVGPSGEVYVAWEDFRVLPRPDIRISKSTDGGVSFGAGGVDNTIVAPVDIVGALRLCGPANPRFVLNGNIRLNDFPSIAVNPTNGHVYLVFNSDPGGADMADVFFTRSTDGAATWSAPTRVNDDATTNDQWFPAVAVQPDGTLAAMWYDRRLDPLNRKIDVFMAVSTDGGLSFQPNTRVTDVSFPVPKLNPNFDAIVAACYMGDYNWVAADASRFYLAWGDNRDRFRAEQRRFLPDPNVYFSSIAP